MVGSPNATAERADVRQFQQFLRQLAEIGARAAEQNISLEDTLRSDELTADAEYTPIKFIVELGFDRCFVLRRAWEEATDNVERPN